jgi:hypothetical protein
MEFPVFKHNGHKSGWCFAWAGGVALTALVAANDFAGAAPSLKVGQVSVSRPAGEPIMAIVSLRDQQITVYDDKGWIMRAPVSSGQRERETPAGIFTILQKNADHYSNIYDDAFMPHMQRLTWSGIALHGGALPGYPASHGCVRMPYDFAEKLFGLTRLGMRVIVSPGAAEPVPIDVSALLRPKTGVLAAAASAAETAEREAAARAEKARSFAMRAHREWVAAMVPVRRMETLRLKAEWNAGLADRAAASATAEGQQQAEEARAGAQARIRELEVQLAAGKEELAPKAAAMTHAREAALAAEELRVQAAETAMKAARALEPVSIFISRKTRRLYVRQSREPIFEAPVTFTDGDRKIGTHIFTAIGSVGGDLRWNVVSIGGHPGKSAAKKNVGKNDMLPASENATAALGRIIIPGEALDFIAERVRPRSSFIISDEALSPEAGEATEFIVTLTDQPQGSLKARPRASRIEARIERFPPF